ncbi:MAG: TIGR04255 family protein [Propionicimonas sp.]|nr:TIGR04255 family protein [Propionicimonas sp.]
MTAGEDDVLLRYLANPPVVEAVGGVSFRSRPMDVVALVRETSRWAADYPIVTSQPPLPPERPLGQPGSGFEMQMLQGVGPSRLWSVSEDQTWLVQTQEDRLLVNWRKVPTETSYAGFSALRERLVALHAQLERPQGAELAPLVAEFTYVNQIDADVRGLHLTYSIFRKPERKLPGEVVTERYEAVSRVASEYGTGQLTVAIQPTPGEAPATMLTVTTKLFAGRVLSEPDFATLVDEAHASSKEAFFAVVSDATTSRWEGTS